MKKWLIVHFDVQKGMYFDRVYHKDEMVYFGSDNIKDSVWNYGTFDEISVENIYKFEEFCKEIGKPCNLYLSIEDAKKYHGLLTELGYCAPMEEDFITETWMEFDTKKYRLEKNYKVEKCDSKKSKSDFIEVFLAAYGGEKTPEKPYGELPLEYKETLEKSLDNPKFYNFICYFENIPVSIATLCMDGDNGGLYNIGTKPEYEKRGFGLAVTNACIEQWELLCGRQLFLQTETGTGIDSWYERLGFKKIFDGVTYEKC